MQPAKATAAMEVDEDKLEAMAAAYFAAESGDGEEVAAKKRKFADSIRGVLCQNKTAEGKGPQQQHY